MVQSLYYPAANGDILLSPRYCSMGTPRKPWVELGQLSEIHHEDRDVCINFGNHRSDGGG